MTRVRWAEPADIVAYYGDDAKPTMQAVVLDVDGELLGVAGLYCDSGRLICFSDFRPQSSLYKKSIIRGAQLLLELMHKKRRPIYAVRDETVSSSSRFLAYLGFEQEGDYYVWHS